MKKRVLSLLLALVLCLGLLPTNGEAGVVSGSGDWPYEGGVELTNAEIYALLPDQPPEVLRPENVAETEYWSKAYVNGDYWTPDKSKEEIFQEIIALTEQLTRGKGSETEKAKAIYSWVAENIAYDYDAYREIKMDRNSRSPRVGAAGDAFYTFYNRMGVCEGYTMLANLMLTLAGLPAACITGVARNYGPHAWSVVCADGRWIIFDATWSEWDMSPDYHQSTDHITLPEGMYLCIFSRDEAPQWILMPGYTLPASVTVPGQITNTGDIFSRNEDLTDVILSDGVTTISENAFQGCTNLTSITIPDSVTTIGKDAFYGCTSLTSVTMPGGITAIGDCAFYGCTNLASVTMRVNAVAIAPKAFYNCTGLVSVTMSGSTASIGTKAFENCRSLTNITIPAGITAIEDFTFYYCESLTAVTIPDGVTTIGDRAFDNCGSLAAVAIPDSVTTIDDRAFRSCKGLTAVTIPNSVTRIGENAFDNCRNLTAVTIPDSVTAIGAGAFSDCVSLTDVTLPNSITTIEGGLFNGCTSLTGVTIPDSVTRINSGVFWECTSLTSMVIPDSVTVIEDGLFPYCSSLTDVTFPSSITSPWDMKNGFTQCSKLSSVTLPEGTAAIGRNAFNQCYKLTSVVIPASVTEMDWSAFKYCYKLSDIYYGGTKEQWNAIAQTGSSKDKQSSYLKQATIHYNSAGPETPAPKPEPPKTADETQKFNDVPADAWYAKAVNAMAETGLLLGDGNGKFNPDAPITFGEFATLLCRIYGLSTDEHTPHEQDGAMCDSSHWASGALWMTTVWPSHFVIFPRACADAGELVNRGEAIDALDTITNSMPRYLEIPYDEYDEYGDPIGPRHITEKLWTIDDIPDGDIIRKQNGTTGFHNAHGWNWTGIVDAYNMGIVSGDETGACNPLGNITRAEVCQIMYNMGLTAPGCVTYRLP